MLSVYLREDQISSLQELRWNKEKVTEGVWELRRPEGMNLRINHWLLRPFLRKTVQPKIGSMMQQD